MENYSPSTGADLEMVWDADNTLRAANQTLPKSKTKCCFSILPAWEEKILTGGHVYLWSGLCRTVEFLPALPLLSALYLVIWCSSCRSFSFTQQKIQHHNLLCHSLLICIKILSLLTLKFSLLIHTEVFVGFYIYAQWNTATIFLLHCCWHSTKGGQRGDLSQISSPSEVFLLPEENKPHRVWYRFDKLTYSIT